MKKKTVVGKLFMGTAEFNYRTGTKNEICVSLVYSGNVNEILFSFPLYTRETQISFFVPAIEWKSFPNKIS
jgi:hypothetical protein